MTSEEKKAKRAAKHEIQDRLRKKAMRSLGMYSTNGQINASIKTVTDRLFSEARNVKIRVRPIKPSDQQTT